MNNSKKFSIFRDANLSAKGLTDIKSNIAEANSLFSKQLTNVQMQRIVSFSLGYPNSKQIMHGCPWCCDFFWVNGDIPAYGVIGIEPCKGTAHNFVCPWCIHGKDA